ncbi:MAG: hypothetical protein K0S23_2889 [Fluviicola sp.]|jgi:uncharacterized protein (DUF885 family)|uniref:DUF885 domain-containing protein n=1 Tax=Fluviicola sp. TaxID=1917219 RepID=UPI002601CF64|nr:DUF885 domain-containing protein [Fluviicola sp.]MDF3028582.1 hypothetical protein [Fluviicola sp.]
MKKRIVYVYGAFLFAILGLLTACPKSNVNADAEFDKYKEAFVLRLWEMNPGWASGSGYHKYDSVLVVPDKERQSKEREFIQKELDQLNQFESEELADANQIDYKLIKNYLDASAWELAFFKSGEWNPSNYNICGGFAEMLANNYAPLDERLRNFSIRLKNVPAYYKAAKANIKNPTKEHTQLAIEQNRGGLSVFTADLPASLEKSTLSTKEKNVLLARSKAAQNAIEEYASWLEKLPNPNPRSFRIGSKLYAKKFGFDIQSDNSAKEIYQSALIHKKELHQKMVKISRQIWNKHMGSKAMPENEYELVKQLIDQISLQHTQPDNFQKDIEKQIPELEKFVKQKNLIYLDPKKPLVVRREPDYMAGVAGASISAPGPYDKGGNTYYNVGSLNGWPTERSESYLREYNDYVLQILNIHEAVPGHYTQLVYSNNSPSIIKSIFGNGAMVEGWAVYTELMMLENGYKNSPEMWLMYYKWNLRTTCNTILDYSVHNLGFSKEQAMNLLVNEAYQQQAEAEGKWKRATLTQVQLCSYYTGFTEICSLRKELMKKQGKNFSLKTFHEKFLSYGSAPVRDIRELMLSKN